MLPFPIVDAHVHLWDAAHFPIRWIAGDPVLERRYLVPEYHEHTAGIDIAALIYVQVDVEPAYGLLEAQWANAQAEIDPRLQAIVAWAPMEYGEQARAYLDALIGIGPRIKGVRRILQGEANPRFCLQPAFVQGVQLLADYNLSFDICINHRQLGPVIELVRQCPSVQFMLDHLAKPGIRDGLWEPWRNEIEQLAQLPNVMCKLSGVVTEADHQHWTVEGIAPYVRHVLGAFGEDRVAFGSDWPVVNLAAEYGRWIETLDALTADLSLQARRKLWSANARRFYRCADAESETA